MGSPLLLLQLEDLRVIKDPREFSIPLKETLVFVLIYYFYKDMLG